jgi:mRNA-degrading endonuclease RelE of RelBE toxin-antitoxin system
MMRVEVSDQVRDFVRGQAPEPRHKLRHAIRRLALERGDIRALEGPLKGFHRLRVGAYRVVFTYALEEGNPMAIRCLFAETQDIVYGVFSERLKAKLLRQK